MHVAVVEAPADPLFDVASVRGRLQLPATIADETVEAYIAAAVSAWDGPYATGQDALSRSLGKWTLQLEAAHFPGQLGWDHPHYERAWHYLRHRGWIVLPYPDVIAVDSIAYTDRSGTAQTLDPSQYVVQGRKITPAAGVRWPVTLCQPGSVMVTYRTGYDPDANPPNPLPAALLQAVCLKVQQMNSMGRADPLLKVDTVIGVGSYQYETSSSVQGQYDQAVEALIGGLRIYA